MTNHIKIEMKQIKNPNISKLIVRAKKYLKKELNLIMNVHACY